MGSPWGPPQQHTVLKPCIHTRGTAQICTKMTPQKRSPSAADLGIRSVSTLLSLRLRRQFIYKVKFEPQGSNLNHINLHLSLF